MRAVSINSMSIFNKTESAVFYLCRFSLFLKDSFIQIK